MRKKSKKLERQRVERDTGERKQRFRKRNRERKVK